MAGSRKLEIVIAGDAKGATKAFDETHGGLSKLGDGVKDFAKVAAVAMTGAVIAAGAFAKSAISAASDLAESQGKVSVVFKEQAAEIEAWASKSAKAFGQSKQSALEAVGTYGNLFQAFGVGRKESAQMSKSLVELAADLASFNNTSVDEALLALRSGLSGETEPLKRFGVAINDARLKDEALRMGLIKTTKEALTPGAKAQAAYALIMKDTALAQGDFARTSDGLANQSRILKAQFSDLQAEIGAKLLPVVVGIASALNEHVFPAIDRISKDPRFKQFLSDVGDTAKAVFGWLQENVPPILAAVSEFINIHVIPAVQDLAHWVNTDLRAAVEKLVTAFKEKLWPVLEEDVIPKLKELGQWIKDEVAPRIGALAVIILEDIIPAFMDLIVFIDKEVVPAIMAIVGPIAKIVEIVDKLTSMLFGHGGSTFDPLGGWSPRGENFVTPGGSSVFGPGPGETFRVPGRAMGGPVSAGRSYVVGENGPEWFSPGRSGHITPNGGQTFIFEMNGREFARAIVDESTRSGGLPIRIRAAS